MRVNGEMYLLINGWVSFLSLKVTACLLRIRFRRFRAAAASLFSAGYAVAAWLGPAYLRGFAAATAVNGCAALIALGGKWGCGAALLLPVGFLFSGLSGYLLKRGVGAWLMLPAFWAAAEAMVLLVRYSRLSPGGPYRLRVWYRGNAITVPAMRDSGNLLYDAVSGLPVIVADAECAGRLANSAVRACDLSMLPDGFRLIPVRTAAGRKTLMCVCPDRVDVLSRGKTKRVEAVLAFADLPAGKALLPDGIFDYAMGEGYHAGA